MYAYPGWFCLAMGGLARVADDNVKLHGGTDPHRPLPRRHRADEWLVGRIGDHPRWRRHLVRAVAGDPALPGMDGAVRRQQPAPARRRAAAVGGHGHDGSRHRLACRGERQRRRRRAVRAADDHRPGRGLDYSDIDVDPARRRSVPGGRPRAPDAPERLLDLRGRGARPGRRSARPRSRARTSSCSGCAPGRSCASIATRIRPGAASASA